MLSSWWRSSGGFQFCWSRFSFKQDLCFWILDWVFLSVASPLYVVASLSLNLGGLGGWVFCSSRADPWFVSVQDPGPREFLPPPFGRPYLLLPLPQNSRPWEARGRVGSGFLPSPISLRLLSWMRQCCREWAELCAARHRGSALWSPDLLFTFLLHTSRRPACEWAQSSSRLGSQGYSPITLVHTQPWRIFKTLKLFSSSCFSCSHLFLPGFTKGR